MTYTFDGQNDKARPYERRVVNAMCKAFGARPARLGREEEMGCQRLGIDAVIDRTDEPYPFRWLIEVKVDFRAAETGNFAVEFLSNDATGRLGWAYTTNSYVCFLNVGTGDVYVVPGPRIRRRMADWRRQFRTGKAPNKGYQTHSVLVPVDNIAILACAKFRLPPDGTD